MKNEKKTTKQKLLWLRDISRDSWPMLIFMLMYILVFTLLEKATRLHYTVIQDCIIRSFTLLWMTEFRSSSILWFRISCGSAISHST